MCQIKNLRFVSFLLWLISLALPGFVFTNGPAYFGYSILVFGWEGIFVANIAWFANIIGLIAFNTKNKAVGITLTVIAFLMGLEAFTLQQVPQNEGGVNNLIVSHLGAGYYVWMASFVVLGAYHCVKKSNLTPTVPPKSV